MTVMNKSNNEVLETVNKGSKPLSKYFNIQYNKVQVNSKSKTKILKKK
jgi:hypothetical protein